MKVFKNQSKNLLSMKMTVNYLNFVFQFIKITKWHFGYTDSVTSVIAIIADLTLRVFIGVHLRSR